uniref:Uncharacterized protein n=1 Tax=Rhizophora mucronata TaxID=61149 RepID=A0A2P2QSQ9_RHIMU
MTWEAAEGKPENQHKSCRNNLPTRLCGHCLVLANILEHLAVV